MSILKTSAAVIMQFHAAPDAAEWGSPSHLRGFTAIVPCVSAGGVDALAIDALVTSALAAGRDVRVIGSLSAPYIPEVIGVRPYAQAGGPALATAMDVLVFVKERVVVLTQRVAVAEGHHEALAADMLEWLQNACGVRRVIAVAGADACVAPDAFKRGSPFVYVHAQAPGGEDAAKERTDNDAAWEAHGIRAWKPIESAVSSDRARVCVATEEDEEDASGERAPRVPSKDAMECTANTFGGLWASGYASVYHRRVLSAQPHAHIRTHTHADASESHAAACPAWTTLVMFLNEGDNINEAIAFADAIAVCAGLSVPSRASVCVCTHTRTCERMRCNMCVVIPKYWAHLYGAPLNLETGLLGF